MLAHGKTWVAVARGRVTEDSLLWRHGSRAVDTATLAVFTVLRRIRCFLCSSVNFVSHLLAWSVEIPLPKADLNLMNMIH